MFVLLNTFYYIHFHLFFDEFLAIYKETTKDALDMNRLND